MCYFIIAPTFNCFAQEVYICACARVSCAYVFIFPMCFFPNPNLNITGSAYKKGVTSFPCGGCPECMSARANKIVLRDVYEAMDHEHNCMCTLTYDSYIRDSHGHIVGEKLNLRSVNVRDCQLFIKRLRIYVQRHYGVSFKYRLSAEYGKKTHRPHYHVLFFGWTFPDVVRYKKSRRGNWIYTSALLTKIWGHGICTVDSVRVSPSIARYCSKYTSKDHGAEDTFSLCSHGIGIDSLCRHFNGLYYVVEGRRYSIPREVWQRYITELYEGRYHFTTKYVNLSSAPLSVVRRNRRLRKAYRIIRDHDPLYVEYLSFWKRQSDNWKLLQPSVFDRIRSLPDSEYYFYKQRAFSVLLKRLNGVPSVPPRSSSFAPYFRYLESVGIPFPHLPDSSCLNRANDTFSRNFQKKRLKRFFRGSFERFFSKKSLVQLDFFSETS